MVVSGLLFQFCLLLLFCVTQGGRWRGSGEDLGGLLLPYRRGRGGRLLSDLC